MPRSSRKYARTFFAADDIDAKTKTGALATAFLLSYMVSAPIFGRMADRLPRWWIIGGGVVVWSLASGATGLAGSFAILLITRIFVGIGEGAYGPAAPTILADLYPLQIRGRVMAMFFMAIPVGSALGYGFAGFVGAHWDWRWAFYLVVPPGLILAGLCCLDAGTAAGRKRPEAQAGPAGRYPDASSKLALMC